MCVDTRQFGRKAMTRLFVVPTPVVPDMNYSSLRKRVAPQPPPTGLDTSGGSLLSSPHYGTLPSASSHSRTTSEPILTSYNQIVPHALRNLNTTTTTNLNHKRSTSGDSSTGSGPDELRKFITQEPRVFGFFLFFFLLLFCLHFLSFFKLFSFIVDLF